MPVAAPRSRNRHHQHRLAPHHQLVADAPETCQPEQSDQQLHTNILAAELSKRLEKHVKMRALVAWLVENRFRGKQGDLCNALSMTPSWLSLYKKGKNGRGNDMSLGELDARYRSLQSALERAGLPLEIPVATAPAAANPPVGGSRRAAAASGSGGGVALPQQPANRTAADVAPKAAIIAVNLKDVEGANQGGQVHMVSQSPMCAGRLIGRVVELSFTSVTGCAAAVNFRQGRAAH